MSASAALSCSWCAPLYLIVTSADASWDCCKGSCQHCVKSCINSANVRVSRGNSSFGLQSIARDSPHTSRSRIPCPIITPQSKCIWDMILHISHANISTPIVLASIPIVVGCPFHGQSVVIHIQGIHVMIRT